jgi:hypothetical protein
MLRVVDPVIDLVIDRVIDSADSVSPLSRPVPRIASGASWSEKCDAPGPSRE